MKTLSDTALEKVTGGNGYTEADPLNVIDEILGNKQNNDDPPLVDLNPNLNFIFGDDIEIKVL